MSSEQEASSMPEGSHLIALTSFCQTQDSLVEPFNGAGELHWHMNATEKAVYRVALESLEGPVAAEATHVDAHVCAAGGEGGVVLPVDIQRRSCGIF